MAFPERGAGDPDEPGLLLQLLQVSHSAITHARPQAADQLKDGVGQGTLVGDPALNALGNQLLHVFLEIPVSASRLHRPEGAHAPVHLEPPSLEDLRSEEHTSELQSRENLVCRLLLEKK